MTMIAPKFMACLCRVVQRRRLTPRRYTTWADFSTRGQDLAKIKKKVDNRSLLDVDKESGKNRHFRPAVAELKSYERSGSWISDSSGDPTYYYECPSISFRLSS